jgi:ABC-type glycerol-3-phosphate transport system substrate-binding protein
LSAPNYTLRKLITGTAQMFFLPIKICRAPQTKRAGGCYALCLWRGFMCGAAALAFFSCAVPYKKPLVIWTNRAEFASYVELFNASQSHVKAIAIYKQSPARVFPPPRGEDPPDIIAAPGLKNGKTRVNFLPLDQLFTERRINEYDFYKNLLDYGIIGGKTYLLPVSFNLPAVIFDSKHEEIMPHEHLISLDQIRDTARGFNAKNKNQWAAMGFGPSWEKSFLYLAAKLRGARFSSDASNSLAWDDAALNDTVQFLREWTLNANTATEAEEDFAFKYLYTPPERRVVSGKCLFAYIPSNNLFMIPANAQNQIGFRWVHENFQIPAEDASVYLGVNKKSKNAAAAEIFAAWFFQQETQRALLERVSAMRLNTGTFGIAGGFSGMRDVTERVFPTYYPLLLGNIPAPDYLIAPNVFPSQWQDIKEQVVIPYLAAAGDTRNAKGAEKNLAARLAEWRMKWF